MNMFTSKSISTRVQAVLKKRIADAEATFKAESARIDKDADLAIQNIRTAAFGEKEDLADILVRELLGDK